MFSSIPSNTFDYIKKYDSVFSEEECKNIIKNLELTGWYKHQYSGYDLATSHTKDNDLSVKHSDCLEARSLQKELWSVIDEYIRKDINFYWFNNWNGYSQVRFNKYDKNEHMRLHCDHIYSLFDGEIRGVPTLTVLGVLNNDYEGGNFLLCGKQFKLNTGDVLVFPSNFMFPHCVEPVTKGVRYSYVSWVW